MSEATINLFEKISAKVDSTYSDGRELVQSAENWTLDRNDVVRMEVDANDPSITHFIPIGAGTVQITCNLLVNFK